MIAVPIKRLSHFPKGSSLPDYMSENASGIDLRAAIPEVLSLKPLERVLIPTGIAIAIPVGFEAQLRPRSGLALSRGLSLPNTPGTIDADYRGEIKVLMINLSNEVVSIEPGERIAQMVFLPVARAKWQEVDELPETKRGSGGFGHTGVS